MYQQQNNNTVLYRTFCTTDNWCLVNYGLKLVMARSDKNNPIWLPLTTLADTHLYDLKIVRARHS